MSGPGGDTRTGSTGVMAAVAETCTAVPSSAYESGTSTDSTGSGTSALVRLPRQGGRRYGRSPGSRLVPAGSALSSSAGPAPASADWPGRGSDRGFAKGWSDLPVQETGRAGQRAKTGRWSELRPQEDRKSGQPFGKPPVSPTSRPNGGASSAATPERNATDATRALRHLSASPQPPPTPRAEPERHRDGRSRTRPLPTPPRSRALEPHAQAASRNRLTARPLAVSLRQLHPHPPEGEVPA